MSEKKPDDIDTPIIPQRPPPPPPDRAAPEPPPEPADEEKGPATAPARAPSRLDRGREKPRRNTPPEGTAVVINRTPGSGRGRAQQGPAGISSLVILC